MLQAMTDAPAQRSNAWLEARKGRITGSSAAAFLGLSPWLSKEDAMRRLVRDTLGAPREDENDFARAIMDHGVYAEPGVIFDFELETGLKVEPLSFIPIEDYSGASPDGKVSDGGILEAKAPWSKRKDTNPIFKPLAEQPHYECQVHLEMAASGASHAHFYQWAPNGAKHEIIQRDQAYIDDILPRLKQIHAQYLWEVAENAEDHLAPRRVEIDTPDISRALKEWDEICEQLDNLEERKKDLLAELVAASGEKNALLGGSRKLTKTERKGSIGYAAIVKSKLPDLDLEPYRGKSSTFWQLR